MHNSFHFAFLVVVLLQALLGTRMNAHKFVRHAFAEMNHDDMKWLKGDNINVMNIYSGVNLHLKPPPSHPPTIQSYEQHAIHELCSVVTFLIKWNSRWNRNYRLSRLLWDFPIFFISYLRPIHSRRDLLLEHTISTQPSQRHNACTYSMIHDRPIEWKCFAGEKAKSR